MKPANYLASLRERSGPTQTMRHLPPVAKREAESAGLDPKKLLAQVNSVDFGQYLYGLLRPRLPRELQELFTEGYIAIGAINDDSPNAYVKRLGEEGYAIIFHSGLKEFIYRLARALSTRFFPSSGHSTSHTAPPLFETARIIAEIFWWYQETGRAFGPSYEITDEQIQVASMLAIEAELFLIAHEIGHVITDAGLDSAFAKRITAIEASASHEEEHAADAIAFRIVLELFNPAADRRPSLLQLRYAGVEFVLRVFATLEKLGFVFLETHPRASRRLDFIRSEARRLVEDENAWDSLSVLATGVESLFAEMARIMENPGEHESFYVRAAESVVVQLSNLLAKCTGGMVPDYVGFYEGASEVFNQGYSHRLLSEVAAVASRFFANVREDGGRPKDREQGWRDFQKFKLLWAFIDQHMTEPARSLFLREFDRAGMEPG